MLKKNSYNEIVSQTERDEDDLKYILEINRAYAVRIAHFIKLNKLSNEQAAKILKIDISVLNDYLKLINSSP